jgi:6-phosphofructo-2-kinase
MSVTTGVPEQLGPPKDPLLLPVLAPNINIADSTATSPVTPLQMNGDSGTVSSDSKSDIPTTPKQIDQSAKFFDPDNKEGFQLREQVAHESLDDLLKYVLEDGGAVGILDATNHTQQRRTSLMKHIRERDATINVLFLESRCEDQHLLESNMLLKLSGPDYRDRDPVAALKDFHARVEQYTRNYQQLGDHEESCGMPYCSMIDVGRKMISYQVQGFLSIQAVTYLMNFNLAPRQIWLTRHGESIDNVIGRIGGDSGLSPDGLRYARALEKFIREQRNVWEQHQLEKEATIHFPPRPGDTTPPNPAYTGQTSADHRNFCVWTSMLERSVQTAQFFNDEEFDIKQMRMLDELSPGSMEGMTYEEIKNKFPKELQLRNRDKLHYRYPGPGGEGYLDVINRLRKVILEVERMTDHVLIIGHRSITRVLLAYFKGLKQEDISDLDVPLDVLYMLEPVISPSISFIVAIH